MQLIAALLLLAVMPAMAQPTPVTQNVYRLPFANGSSVFVSNSHEQHLNRLDLSIPGSGTANIVAAAAGIVRIVVDEHRTACVRPRLADFQPPNAMSDYDASGNSRISFTEMTTAFNAEGAAWLQSAAVSACAGYGGPAGSGNCCMRRYERVSGSSCPSGATRTCLAGNPPNGPNNYVWIEHENGEWTKYSHFRRNDVRVSVGQNVDAGEILGLEGDIGFVTGPHLHFEVAAIDSINDIDADGFVQDVDSIDGINIRHRVPVFCQLGVLADNDTVVAVACDDQCGSSNKTVSNSIGGSAARLEQVSNRLTVTSVIQPGSGFSARAAQQIHIQPGFVAKGGSFFAATISGCDRPGGTGE